MKKEEFKKIISEADFESTNRYICESVYEYRCVDDINITLELHEEIKDSLYDDPFFKEFEKLKHCTLKFLYNNNIILEKYCVLFEYLKPMFLPYPDFTDENGEFEIGGKECFMFNEEEILRLNYLLHGHKDHLRSLILNLKERDDIIIR
jgi:hypothetical protein